METDPVKKPEHYRWIPGIECKEVASRFDYNRGSAIKYIWRSGRKPGISERQDLEKAIEALKNRLRYIDGADYDEIAELEELMP